MIFAHRTDVAPVVGRGSTPGPGGAGAFSLERNLVIPSHLVAAVTRQRAIDAAIDLAVGDINDPAAFTRLVTAVSLHIDAERQKQATPTPVVPFGWQKGRSLTVLTLNQLQRLEQYITGTIHNTKKAQFRDSNLTLRAAILAELHRRTKGT